MAPLFIFTKNKMPTYLHTDTPKALNITNPHLRKGKGRYSILLRRKMFDREQVKKLDVGT